MYGCDPNTKRRHIDEYNIYQYFGLLRKVCTFKALNSLHFMVTNMGVVMWEKNSILRGG